MVASSSFHQSGLVNLISTLFRSEKAILEDPKIATDHVLIVDVGGGRGTIMKEVRKARPDLQGAIIVQDLPKEIEGREPSEGIQTMPYNFLHSQSVERALLL